MHARLGIQLRCIRKAQRFAIHVRDAVVGMAVDFVVFFVFWYLDLGLVGFLWRTKFRSAA